MTEAEWNNCADPQLMLEFLRECGKLSDRKARLYAVACCRSVWDKLSEPASRRAVEVAEQSANGKATKEEFDTASDAADEVPWMFVERGTTPRRASPTLPAGLPPRTPRPPPR